VLRIRTGGDAAFSSPTLLALLLPQERRELLAAWARLYGREHLPTYDEAVSRRKTEPDAFLQVHMYGCSSPALLDTDLYKRRMRLSIEHFCCSRRRRRTTTPLHTLQP